jgi:hypothetical protein
VDTFTLIVAGSMVLLIVTVLLLGLFHPKSGAEILDWRPTRSAEAEVQNEIDDFDQMIAAQNELRARHGKAPRTQDDVEADVRRHKAEMDDYSERYWESQRALGRRPTKKDL